MASTANKTIRSTDRGGVVSLTAGILFLALGFGLLIGITLQASSRTVFALNEMVSGTALHPSGETIVVLKKIAFGLGGILYFIVPYFIVWLGGLLCVSARHYVSFRIYMISLLLFITLLALLTLLISVPGFGTLMQYIHKVNPNHQNMSEADSFSESLAGAYQRFAYKQLPDGGLLGMLLAFPIWKVLGQVGGVIFLVFTIISLMFALFRINPVRLYQKVELLLQGGKNQSKKDQEQINAQPADKAPAQVAIASDAVRPDIRDAAGFQPQEAPYYVEPWQDKKPAVARELYSQEPVFTAPAGWQLHSSSAKSQEENFTAVDNDYFEKFEQLPETPDKPKRSPISPRPTIVPSITSMPPAVSAVYSGLETPQRHNKTDQLEKQSVSQNNLASNLIKPSEPVQGEEALTASSLLAKQESREEKDYSTRPTFSDISSSVINEVGTAPAVSLTGERVAVRPNSRMAAHASRMDGTAMPKPQVRQTSLAIDQYQRPTTDLMTAPAPDTKYDTTDEDNRRADKLISTLASFNITATVKQVVHGPAVTSFGIRLAEGVNINKLRNVMDNISVELLAKSPARAEIPIPGTPLIGIEVSNEKASMVYLREILESPKMRELKSPSSVALGKDIYGAPVICELMDMPHLLIAGATGSGKSVCINSIITSLLYRSSPKEVRMILIDPKFVELQPYNEVPHLLLPVVVDPKKAVMALEWVCQEMDIRYKTLEKHHVRNLDAYNAKLDADEDPMPRIIVIVDEMADLMFTAGKAIDEHIKRITAKARAAGICLILATQRPSVDVITGIIKANIPSRIAFQVSSQVDSRTILDSQGAEKLLGYGDMLYFPRTLKAPKRVQGCFISDKDVGAVADFVKSRNQTDYNADIREHIEKEEKKDSSAGTGGEEGSDGSIDSFDELLPKAIEMAVEAGQMSISMLQRVLRVGYGRAGRLIDEMSRRSIISGNEGTKPRKTLMSREEYQQLLDEDKPF